MKILSYDTPIFAIPVIAILLLVIVCGIVRLIITEVKYRKNKKVYMSSDLAVMLTREIEYLQLRGDVLLVMTLASLLLCVMLTIIL